MKILVFARSTTGHPGAGGMETSAKNLLSTVNHRGNELALVTTAGGNSSLDPIGWRHRWEIPTKRPGKYSWRWWRATGQNGPWNEWGPDLVIGIGDSARGYERRIHRVPVVNHCHGTTLMEAQGAFKTGGVHGFLRGLLNLARTPARLRHLRECDLVIAAGPRIGAALERRPYSVDASKLVMISNFVDDPGPTHEPETKGGRPIRVGFVGRVEREKGVDRALAVSDSLTNHFSSVELLVIGVGAESGRLARMMTNVNDRLRVIETGRVDPDRMGEKYRQLDLILMPSRRVEGLPMVVLEGAAHGVPILGTPSAGIPADLVGDSAMVAEYDAEVWTERAVELVRQHHAAYLGAKYTRKVAANLFTERLESLVTAR